MPKTRKKEVKTGGSSSQGDSKLFAFLAVFLSIVGFVIALVTKKDDKYVMFYAKQSLVLFIAWIVLWIVGLILAFIPILGWLIDLVLWIGLVILWIIGWIYALSGEQKQIPVIGKFAEKLNF